jgi:hypothetical protein
VFVTVFNLGDFKIYHPNKSCTHCWKTQYNLWRNQSFSVGAATKGTSIARIKNTQSSSKSVSTTFQSEVERLLQSSLAENTFKTYSQGIASFERFCIQTTSIISEYIAYMSLQHYAHSTVSGHVAVISYKCEINNLTDNTKQFVINSLLEGLRRSRRADDTRRPITREILSKLIKALSNVCRSPYETLLFRSIFISLHGIVFTAANKHSCKTVLF